jgi:uncharacterized protein
MLNTTPSLVDTSFWVALAFSKHPSQTLAQQVFGEADSAQPIAFCRATQQYFFAAHHHSQTASALRQFALIQSTSLDLVAAAPRPASGDFPGGPPGIAAHWQKCASRPSPSPKAWMAAYLTAFARGHGIPLVTLDKDFKNFPGLRLRFLS